MPRIPFEAVLLVNRIETGAADVDAIIDVQGSGIVGDDIVGAGVKDEAIVAVREGRVVGDNVAVAGRLKVDT